MLTGKVIKLIEIRDDLHSFIKELELKRVKNNLYNTKGLNSLYEVYYNVNNTINNELEDCKNE